MGPSMVLCEQDELLFLFWRLIALFIQVLCDVFSLGQGWGADGFDRYHSAPGLLVLHQAQCPVSLALPSCAAT